MRLSEVKNGAPIYIEVYEKEELITKIWGKVSKLSEKSTSIEIFCYDGLSTNFSQNKYTIKATAYFDGEHEIDFSKETFGKDNIFSEKRDNFRIYVGEPSEGYVNDRETTLLLVDVGHGGFRIMSREQYKVGSTVTVKAEFVEPEAVLTGKIVWNKDAGIDKYAYGCVLEDSTKKEDVQRVIDNKQKKLQDEITAEIKKNS